MVKKLRVGIVGAGGICVGAHLPSYAQLTDIIEVVAIADIVPERAKAAAEKFGIPHYFASVEELLANVDVDYIDICTWTAAHAPVCIAAAKAGKHILCEKPLAATLEQGLAMEKAVKEIIPCLQNWQRSCRMTGSSAATASGSTTAAVTSWISAIPRSAPLPMRSSTAL